MKAKDVSEELIGKRCKCIFTGLMVTGTIEEIKVGEHTAEVRVRYDDCLLYTSPSPRDA